MTDLYFFLLHNILLILLYILGGFVTLIFNYHQTDDEPKPIDIILFLLWPFAAVPAILALVLFSPIFIAKLIAKKLK